MPSDRSIHSILLLQAGALGDTVLQLRIADGLRRAWPAARVAWLGRDAWCGIAERCVAVDETAKIDALRSHRLFEPEAATPADLTTFLGSRDLLVNGLAGPGSPVMARLQQLAGQALWYEPRPAEGTARHACDQWIAQLAAQLSAEQTEAADRLREYAAHLPAAAGPFLQPRGDDLAEAAQRLREAGVELANPSRLVVVHPGSGGLRKCYPVEHYEQVCRLLSQGNMQPVMVLGPAEVERWGQQAGQRIRHASLILEPRVEMLVAIVQLAAAYVGNDSGPTHVAAAAGVPTVALFGPTDPTIWAPLGPRVTLLRSQEWQQGWSDLPPQRVAEAIAAASRTPA